MDSREQREEEFHSLLKELAAEGDIESLEEIRGFARWLILRDRAALVGRWAGRDGGCRAVRRGGRRVLRLIVGLPIEGRKSGGAR